ncbi:hypothetical protein, partial [Bartonella apis]|uniref:hypothetical protein n=1 Tax=Bartonella apis TaxID=1686310 RepID=UPI00242E0666
NSLSPAAYRPRCGAHIDLTLSQSQQTYRKKMHFFRFFMSIQSYRVPANDYTSKMAQKIASKVSKKAKIFRQKCLSPLSEPKNARKKCVLEHFEAFLTESTPFFQESRLTDKNHPDFAACLERSRYRPIG